VAAIVEGDFIPGCHVVRYDVSAISPGMYFVVLSANGRAVVRMILVRKK
jgi:hypothetical protein